MALALIVGVAGGVAAAGAGFTANSSMGAGQKSVTSPCSNVAANMVPAYDSDGFYKVSVVEVSLSCSQGEFSVRVTLATGPGTYVERTTTALFPAVGTQTVAVVFPTVKVADVTNIAALVIPVGS